MHEKHGGRILLVEDHEDSAEMVTLFLDGEGYETRWVKSGAEALSAAGAEPFDVILLDLTLPDMDGLELGRRLHEVTPAATPILVMSAKSAGAVEDAARAIAAAGFVRKPFATDQLVATIEQALRH